MKLKEKLKAAQTELQDLKAKIEAGEDEAIKRAGELTKEIETLQEQVKTAAKAAGVLSQIGTDEGDGDGVEGATQAKNIGEHVVNAAKAAAHGKRFTITAPEFAAKAYNDVQKTPTTSGVSAFATDLDYNVVTGPRTALVIRDLFSAETISGSALTFLVEGAIEGSAAVTAEGTAKSQVHFADPTPVTVPLKKVTAFIKESDEYIDDYAFLASAVNGRLLYEVGLAEQNEITSDLLGTSGIQTGDLPSEDSVTFMAERILEAISDVQEQGGFAADAIVMHPSNWFKLRTAKDSNGQYYGGGFFGAQNIPNLWGVPVCVTAAVTNKQILVGAFKPCGSVVSKGGVAVEMTNSNEDDFKKNLMAIRAEERLALAVRRPAGFKLITIYTYTKGESGDKAQSGVTYYTRSGSAGEYTYTAVPASEITVGTTDVSGYYTRS